MQITSNTTGMEAGINVAVDKEGRDFCVVVVKGTFTVSGNGDEPRLGEEQVQLVAADEFTGEPGFSAPRSECDFARFKPLCDVLLNGGAYAPDRRPTERVTVSLRVGPLNKSFDVVGNRTWLVGASHLGISKAEPFAHMPISYNNAFGGVDNSQENPEQHRCYLLNHVGVGYHEYLAAKFLDGKPLPNTEESGDRVDSPNAKYRPMSFGPVGRAWQPRVALAGTYDTEWIEHLFPFLPGDFDDRYFQAAPADQQVPYLIGGERVQCINLSPTGTFDFVVPKAEVRVRCRFRDRNVDANPNIDTLTIEPQRHRFTLTWRAAVPIGRKLHALREVLISHESWSRKSRGRKPHFRSLPDLIAWDKKRSALSRPDREG